MMADDAVLEVLGHRLRQERLNRDLSQLELADLAGVSRRTITNLEGGKGANLRNLIGVLRGLNMLDRLDLMLPEPGLSPMQLLALRGKVRQRASGIRKSSLELNEPAIAWTWGE
jgi:transcriptional regulator with XRE-family HTH domain